MSIIDDVLAGYTISTARRRADAREAAARQEAEMQALADQVQMDPQERLVFMTDPEAWAKAHATRLETRTVGHSDTVYTPGQPNYQPGLTPYDQRSLDDTRAKAEADARLRQVEAARRAAADAERARHNRAQEGVASGRLGVAQGNLNERRSRSGRGRPEPSVRRGPTAAPPPPPGFVPVR